MNPRSKHTGSQILDLDVDFAQYQGKKPDFAVVTNSGILLIEVKLTLLNVEARSLALAEQISAACDVKCNLGGAIQQLSEFEEYLNSGESELGQPQSIIKLIVCFDPLYMANGYVRRVIGETIGEKSIINLQIATLTDIEIMGQVLYSGLDLVEALIKKANDPALVVHPIWFYLEDEFESIEYDGCVSDAAKKNFLEELSGSTNGRFNVT